jgi:hypothetical protein
MKLNHWVSSRKETFVRWDIFFPDFEGEKDAEPIIEFADSIVRLGIEERVYHLKEATLSTGRYKEDEHKSYAEFLRIMLKQEKRLCLFTDSHGVHPQFNGQNRSPGEICYYDETGALVEKEVENLGLLLDELKDSTAIGYKPRDTSDRSPITILGGAWPITNFRWKPAVRIELCTDIWFPYVVGPDFRFENFYDNRELANCHTPRLNGFLMGAREAAEKANAEWTWRNEEVGESLYWKWVTETGVLLE